MDKDGAFSISPIFVAGPNTHKGQPCTAIFNTINHTWSKLKRDHRLYPNGGKLIASQGHLYHLGDQSLLNFVTVPIKFENMKVG